MPCGRIESSAAWHQPGVHSTQTPSEWGVTRTFLGLLGAARLVACELRARRRLCFILISAFLTNYCYASPVLIRFASASDDAMAFAARGDLWLAGSNGDSVRRLVQISGDIAAVRFSPDGQWVAYTE